jgi:predicted nuclease of predicted toxin-antitoxin system
VDECTGPAVARWLRDEHGYEVFSVYDEARGAADGYIIAKAFDEDWILITNDKDFGEKVFKERHPHRGVIFLRLEDERPTNQIEVLRRLLENHSGQLTESFVVATESQVRFSGAPPGRC